MSNIKFYNICNTTKFIIYGAGLLGIRFFNILNKNGLGVIYFIDRRAEKIDRGFNIKVVYPESNIITKEEKEKAVVIISLANVFDHYKVAQYLYDIGYKRILYKVNILECRDSKYSSKLNNIYEDLLKGKYIIPNELPEFNSLHNNNLQGDNAIINDNNEEEITAYLPIEVIFTEQTRNENVLKGKYEKYYDHSIYFSTYIIDLFNAFEGKNVKNVQSYVDFYKATHTKYSYIDDKEALRHVGDRFKVYNYMTLALNINKSFFENNPVTVKWSEKGYFNIIDGHHRAIFFLTKNLNKIPCKMKKSDYLRFINQEKLKICLQYIEEYRITCTNNPIPHPYFYLFANRQQNLASLKLSVICAHLEEHNIDIKGLKILEIGSNTSYISQFFCRMGANLTSIEQNGVHFGLATLLNDLFYCKSIEMINKDIRDINHLKDYDISFLLSLMHNYVNTEAGEEILEIINKATKKMMFWESSNNCRQEIEWIIKNSSFKKYEKLKVSFFEDRISELGVFYKE